MKLQQLFTAFIRDTHAATAMEYAMIGALLSIVIIGALTGIGRSMDEDHFSVVNNALAR